jgi:hypothetical protein
MTTIPDDIVATAKHVPENKICVLAALLDNMLEAASNPAFSVQHSPAERNLLDYANYAKRILARMNA